MKQLVGLDVSLAKTAVYVLSERGKTAKKIGWTSEPESLIALLQCPEWKWLCDIVARNVGIH